MLPDKYHYTECGLDYVYLANGFELVDTVRGKQVSIKDIEGLHQAIGKHIVRTRKGLTGSEARFLREELLMSQQTLAKLLNVNVQTVHRWERGKTDKVPGPAESLIRLLYLQDQEESETTEKLRTALKRVAEIEDAIDRLLTLRLETTDHESSWTKSAA